MSDKEDKIFDKPEKPKRKLTQKQLDALARGREKARQKKEEKLAKEGQKDQKKQKKVQKQEKKVKIKEQEILSKIREKEKQDKEDKQKRVKEHRLLEWEERRVKTLEQCKNETQFKIVERALDSITEEDLVDVHKVNSKLKAEQERLLEAEKKLKEEK